MIQFRNEHITPQGGWSYVHPTSGASFNHMVFWSLREIVANHCRANGWDFSEEEFRKNVAIHTPSADVENRQELGDLVASVAQPIAKAIDAVAGAMGVKTNVSGCGGCKKRREKLNQLSERARKLW